MKIHLSPNEVYEIKIPNEINAENFLELFNRFNSIIRLIKINDSQVVNQKPNVEQITIYPKRISKKTNKRDWCNTREKSLDLLQYAYHGTVEDKNRICKIVGMEWFEIGKYFFALKKRFNIKPQEVGLFKFNTGVDRRRYNMPNYTIKSYTGIFDEN